MHKRHGFTIVELFIVISIIAVLAMITIFGFGQWRARTARTEMKYELTIVSTALRNYLNFNNTYPAALNDSLNYQENANVSLTYVLRTDGASYCLSAKSLQVTTIGMLYLDSVNGSITTTACS